MEICALEAELLMSSSSQMGECGSKMQYPRKGASERSDRAVIESPLKSSGKFSWYLYSSKTIHLIYRWTDLAAISGLHASKKALTDVCLSFGCIVA